jgi:hypothetical protein
VTYLEKSFTKIGLEEWLKVKSLSSSPSTAKKKKKRQKKVPLFVFKSHNFLSKLQLKWYIQTLSNMPSSSNMKKSHDGIYLDYISDGTL